MKNVLFLVALFVQLTVFAQSDAKALEIIQKSIDASGGKEKMLAVKSMIRNMEINMPFGTSESESFYKNGKFYTKSTMSGNVVMEQKYDGNRVFMGGMQGNQTIDDEKMVKRMAAQGQIFPLVTMTESGNTIKYDGTAKVDGKETHKLVSTDEDGNATTLFFNSESNLLVRMITKGEFQGNTFENTIDLADYKSIDGIQIAHKMNLANGQFQMEMKTTKVQLNPTIADSMFLIE